MNLGLALDSYAGAVLGTKNCPSRHLLGLFLFFGGVDLVAFLLDVTGVLVTMIILIRRIMMMIMIMPNDGVLGALGLCVSVSDMLRQLDVVVLVFLAGPRLRLA